LGEGLGAEIGAAAFIVLNTWVYTPIHDHRGNVVVLAGASNQTYRYTAFGEELTGHTRSPWRFSSKRVDSETDYVYFGMRYYSPHLGRWVSPDPQGFADGPNLYSYVHNSPLTHLDLYGLWSMGEFFRGLSHKTFSGLEWTGANLIPLPGVQGFVESIGRWGAGGGFRAPSRYRFPNEIITISGNTASHHSCCYSNGMRTDRLEAIKNTTFISKTHYKGPGGAQVDLLYNGTNGWIMDGLSCILGKMGMITGYDKMCRSYYGKNLRDDPEHTFTHYVHSRGGTRLMNTGRFLPKDGVRDRIDVSSFGSASLIPNGYFRSAVNNLSPYDIVSCASPLSMIVGLSTSRYNIKFLKPATHNPLKEHSFLGETYAGEIKELGYQYEDVYFSE